MGAGNHVAVAALSHPVNVTREFRVIPRGPFKAWDGRPAAGTWHLSDQRAHEIVAAAKARPDDFVIDYEHASMRPGAIAPAAGWFKNLDWREGGLYVTDARWTAAAAQRIAANEYRYISPVITFNEATGEVHALFNAALTNNPAVHGLTDLTQAALSALLGPQRGAPLGAETAAVMRMMGITEQQWRGHAATQALAAMPAAGAPISAETAAVMHMMGITEQQWRDHAGRLAVDAPSRQRR